MAVHLARRVRSHLPVVLLSVSCVCLLTLDLLCLTGPTTDLSSTLSLPSASFSPPDSQHRLGTDVNLFCSPSSIIWQHSERLD